MKQPKWRSLTVLAAIFLISSTPGYCLEDSVEVVGADATLDVTGAYFPGQLSNGVPGIHRSLIQGVSSCRDDQNGFEARDYPVTLPRGQYHLKAVKIHISGCMSWLSADVRNSSGSPVDMGPVNGAGAIPFRMMTVFKMPSQWDCWESGDRREMEPNEVLFSNFHPNFQYWGPANGREFTDCMGSRNNADLARELGTGTINYPLPYRAEMRTEDFTSFSSTSLMERMTCATRARNGELTRHPLGRHVTSQIFTLTLGSAASPIATLVLPLRARVEAHVCRDGQELRRNPRGDGAE